MVVNRKTKTGRWRIAKFGKGRRAGWLFFVPTAQKFDECTPSTHSLPITMSPTASCSLTRSLSLQPRRERV